MINKIKKIIFKKFFERKILLLGKSHFLNYRPKYKSLKNISDLDYKIFSQNGEDGIIDYLLYSLDITSPKFIEIGIGDYEESNTRYLFETTNSQGLIIDCIKNLKTKVMKNTKLWRGDLKIIENFIDSENIIKILKENSFYEKIDLFSIDIDGTDYWVLKQIPNNFSKVIIVEYNSNFGHEFEVTVPNIKKFNRTKYHYSNLCFGTSLKAVINLLEKKNYTFIGTNISKMNAFFISNSELNKINLDIPDKNNIKKFTNANFRESKDMNGKLNYLSGNKKLNEIKNCEIVDVSNSKEKLLTIKELYNLNG
jgi:hypothetical protein